MEVVYAGEGTPLIIAPSAVFKTAPGPNAARLFQSFLFSIEAQQGLVDAYGMCSFHRLVKEKVGRRPLSTIKLIKSDPEAMEAQRGWAVECLPRQNPLLLFIGGRCGQNQRRLTRR